MQYAVFFRNLNLGRPKAPHRDQFEQAFLAAGAAEATSFLTNGTLVFTAQDGVEPTEILTLASAQLHTACGLVEPGFLRTVPYLAELVAEAPFAAVDMTTVYACCITFISPTTALPETPLHSSRGDVAILRFTSSEALSTCVIIGKSPGSPNAFLEKQLAVPASTRNWNTVVRLVQKFGEYKPTAEAAR
jgi:uncharacterized protein (DUF1697 family)